MKRRLIYRYYRVPEGREVPRKGRPQPQHVAQYTKGDATFKPQPNGGITECILSVDGRIIVGRAYCSFSDNFSYKVGRELAGTRAVEQMLDLMTPSQLMNVFAATLIAPSVARIISM